MSEIEENGGVFNEWRSTNVVFQLNDDQKSVIDDDAGKVGEENGGGVYADGSNSIRKKGSIAERRAATCGFNASRINVARFRCASPLSSPVVQSPYLTIPCGISPTALLDSPIMLPNSQLSPTTGTFPLPPLNHGSPVLNSPSPATFGERDSGFSYMFQPHDGPFFWPCKLELQNQTAISPELPVELLKEPATKNSATDSSAENNVLANTIPNTCSAALQSCDTGENIIFEGYPKETYPPTGIVKNSEDGYNWRKYGQKHVKGSEYPRSYYKCTHPNCLVKKKVERSLDGQITEIIYKGAHNHQIPHPSHLTAGSPASFADLSETGEGNGSCIKVEGGDVLRNIQLGSKDMKFADGSERSSSTSVQTDNSDPLSSTQGKSVGIFESAGTPEFSSTLCGDDDDGVNDGKLSPGDDADDDRSESKRRKKRNFLMETSMVSRAMREPRVVVQIESEIDILDDGYRWRKYGQKVVKGNPNPRSYYKCTSPGCLVRKHVERASDNPKAVITTYEGKHNHEVPASRNSKNSNMDVGNPPLTVSNRHSNRELPRINGISKLETQFQDHPFEFERKLGSDYTLPSLVGHFGTNMKFGASSSMYQPKFVPSDKSMSFVLPDFPMSLPMSIPGSARTVQGNFGFSKQVEPIDQSRSFVGVPEFRENNARFLRPKQEQQQQQQSLRPKQEQDDNMFETCLPNEDHANAIIPNFPT